MTQQSEKKSFFHVNCHERESFNNGFPFFWWVCFVVEIQKKNLLFALLLSVITNWNHFNADVVSECCKSVWCWDIFNLAFPYICIIFRFEFSSHWKYFCLLHPKHSQCFMNVSLKLTPVYFSCGRPIDLSKNFDKDLIISIVTFSHLIFCRSHQRISCLIESRIKNDDIHFS